jgi:putative redox protein
VIFKAARHPKSFVSLDDADHLLSRPGDARYVADVLAGWAGRYVDVGAPAATEQDLRPPAQTADFADATVSAAIGASGYRTALRARGLDLVADEPASVGGTETGPTPYDFLGMALGACTAMTLRMYADRKGLPLERVHVTVSHDRVHASDCKSCETTSGSLDRLSRTITLTGTLDAATRARMVEIADRCPVHRTLHSEIVVETHLVEDPTAP